MNQLINDKDNIFSKINYFFIIFFPIALISGSLISNLFVVTISIIFIIELLKKKKFYLLYQTNFFFLILIYIYLVLNSFLVANNNESIIRAIGFIRFVFFAYALSYYFSIFKNEIIKFWSLIFLIVTGDIIFEYSFGYNILGLSANYPGRVASFTGDELKIGAYYHGFFLICLSFFLQKQSKAFLIFFSLFVITSFLIGERSNFIKIIIISILYLIFFHKETIKRKIIFSFFIILIIFSALNTNPLLKGKFTHHIFDNFIETTFNNSKFDLKILIRNNQHFGHYNTAFNIFKDKPIFGSGVKTFRYESYKKKYNDIPNLNSGSTHPHQFHFELLSELGIIGYLLILINLISVLIKQKKINENVLKIAGILYLISVLIPILPSGSFFTSYTASLFWLNYSFLLRLEKNN